MRFGTTACEVCSNATGNRVHVAREMLLGTRDPFHYLECGACGCLQLLDVPDLGKYYPSDYYSYDTWSLDIPPSQGGLKDLKRRFIRNKLNEHYFNRTTALGKWLQPRSSMSGDYLPIIQQCRVRLNVGLESRILDAGCGSGRMLANFHALGFQDLTGADPYIKADLSYDTGFRIVKKTLAELEGQFDLIILHHAFEHMAQPLEVLTTLRKLLRQGQFLILAMPVVAAAWKEYGTDWMALDAPRHLHLYRAKAFEELAGKAGFRVADTVFDSREQQFWASEQYRADISFFDSRSYEVNPEKSMFTAERIAEFRAASARLNESGDGDSAIYYLQ